MAANPQFAQTPEFNLVSFSLSGTSSRTSASSNCLRLITGSTASGYYGTKITQIGAKVAGNNNATSVLIFITNTSGTSPKLFDEIALISFTASTTQPSYRNVTSYSDLQLKSGQKVLVGITVAVTDGVNIFAIKGDY